MLRSLLLQKSDLVLSLDQMAERYNQMRERYVKRHGNSSDDLYGYFWECHEELCRLEKEGRIQIIDSAYDLSYLKTLLCNDGPEYCVTITFRAGKKDYYQIGVCVRGTPILKIIDAPIEKRKWVFGK